MTRRTRLIQNFSGEAFIVAVEQAGVNVRVRVTSRAGVGNVPLIEIRCSPAAADELGLLLRPAAALAEHVASGGRAEHWRTVP